MSASGTIELVQPTPYELAQFVGRQYRESHIDVVFGYRKLQHVVGLLDPEEVRMDTASLESISGLEAHMHGMGSTVLLRGERESAGDGACAQGTQATLDQGLRRVAANIPSSDPDIISDIAPTKADSIPLSATQTVPTIIAAWYLASSISPLTTKSR
jgi:hypothetical protein